MLPKHGRESADTQEWNRPITAKCRVIDLFFFAKDFKNVPFEVNIDQ